MKDILIVTGSFGTTIYAEHGKLTRVVISKMPNNKVEDETCDSLYFPIVLYAALDCISDRDFSRLSDFCKEDKSSTQLLNSFKLIRREQNEFRNWKKIETDAKDCIYYRGGLLKYVTLFDCSTEGARDAKRDDHMFSDVLFDILTRIDTHSFIELKKECDGDPMLEDVVRKLVDHYTQKARLFNEFFG